MDLNRVATFVSVVEAESFTAAAARLGVPKSSVSRSVAQLEEELGVRLLQRTTRKLSLTDAGEAFYRRAQPAVLGLDEAGAEAMATLEEPRGTVRMTAPVELGYLVLPQLIVDFTTKYPKVQISLSLSQRTVDLVAEGFDLALRAGKLQDSSLIARKILDTELGLYASPDYLALRGRPTRLADLAKHDCVLFRSRSGRSTWQLKGPNGDEEVEVTGSVETDATFFIAEAAVAGAGIALVATEIAKVPVRTGHIERVLPEYSAKGGALHLVMPSSRFLPSRVLLFRDFLVERMTSFWKDLNVMCTERMEPKVKGAKASNGAKKTSRRRQDSSARA